MSQLLRGLGVGATKLVANFVTTVAAQSASGAGHFVRDTLADASGSLQRLSLGHGPAAAAARKLNDLRNGSPVSGMPLLVDGLPFVGNLLDFLADPVSLLSAAHLRHGNIFSMRLADQLVVVLLGPAYNKLFFDHTDDELSIRDAYPTLAKMFAPNVYFFGSRADYESQRAIVTPLFKGAALGQYVDAMIAETAAFVRALGDHGVLEAPKDLGPLVMYIAAGALVGADFRMRMGREMFDVFREFSGGLHPLFPPNTPLPRFARSRAARTKLHAMFQQAIDERRARGSRGATDFLQTLIDASPEKISTRWASATGALRGRLHPALPVEGALLAPEIDDALIRNMIQMMVWAGHETTVGATGWALADLLEHPVWCERVRAEHARIVGDATPTKALLDQLDILDRTILESGRMNPVAFVLLRKATAAFQAGDYTIPKGTLVMVSPAVSQRLAPFTEPQQFDPDRFLAERHENVRGAMIDFGMGAHKCAGMRFAQLEMKIILAALLDQFDLRILGGTVRPLRGPVTRWPAPFLVRYDRRR